MAKLGEVCDILNGYAFKSNQYTTSGVRIIRISNVQKGYIEDKSPVYYPCDDENVKKYELKQNDLLISLTGNVGRTALLEEKFLPAALNQRVSCVRLKEPDKVLKTYLFHLLNSDYFEQQCMKAAEGVAQKNLSPKWLFEYKIPMYSIERQKEISNTLDKIDLLIILRKQQLAKLDELVKARFVEMFGDAKLNPYDFPCNSLSEYILFLTSGSRGWSRYFTDSGEYFITIKNVKNCRITLQDVQYVTPPDNAEAKRTKVQENDLLISITADLGRTGVVTKRIAEHGAYINQHLTCIRLNLKKANPIYVAYYMESDAGKEQFASKNQSAVKAGLNFNAINSLKLVVPPLDLQNDFAAFVECVDQQKQTIQQSLDKLELMKKALMQEYFG